MVVAKDAKLDARARFFNRELSWLRFNERVLEEALKERQPPLERLKFLCIFGNNLDEFYMIRVAGLKQQLGASVLELSPDGMSPKEQLKRISDMSHQLVERKVRCMLDDVMPLLRTHGIFVHEYQSLPQETREIVDEYFRREVLPVLTPLAVDPGHPFPHLLNLGLNLGFLLEPRDGEGEELFAVLQVPSVLPRLIPLRDMVGGYNYLLLENAICQHADDLFPGYRVTKTFPFRLTRDADLGIAEDEADDLLITVEQSLRHRNQGDAVRLEISPDAPSVIVDSLIEDLQIHQRDVFRIEGPLNPMDLMALTDLDMPSLKDASFTARAIRRESGESIFARIRAGDILLHHPYDSFDPVLGLVSEAADDPRVLAIKQTLYRTSGDSAIVKALMRAAENGKQVTAIVELQARFDEKNNIEWARALEEAGAHVIYGLIGLKTHAKVCLVVRREETGIRRYVHLGTGNYNPKTARIYTDIGLMSARPELGTDASELFNHLTGYSKFEKWQRFLVAPHNMRTQLYELIRREANHAREGKGGRIVAKMNSLSDERIIEELYAASQTGVSIDLIVRGISCLRPGVPGLSENIRVISIVGRFLEHSRVFHFANGGDDQIYTGSADWMTRNLDRRVEIFFPIEDPALRDRMINEVLGTCLADNVQARELKSDGTWVHRTPAEGEPSIETQVVLLKEARHAVPLETSGLQSSDDSRLGKKGRKPINGGQAARMRNRGRRRRESEKGSQTGPLKVPAAPNI